jgi:hypothetical protein
LPEGVLRPAIGRAEMKQILERNNVEQEGKRNFFIQQVRGKLYTAAMQHPPGKTVISKIKADGRANWAGWIDFDREVLDSGSTSASLDVRNPQRSHPWLIVAKIPSRYGDLLDGNC